LNGTYYLNTQGAADPNGFYTVVFDQENKIGYIYKNGVLAVSGAVNDINTPDATKNILLGINHFNGELLDFRIHDGVLNADQVAFLAGE
jgi:hypothetical protein